MSKLTEGLKEVNGSLDLSREMLRTVDYLIKSGEMKKKGDIIQLGEGVDLKTIWGDNATISIATHSKAGNKVLSHCHEAIKEYLICVKGSFSVVLGGGIRILEEGGCASIPESVEHSVISLEDNSQLIAVCIPEDLAYKRSMNCAY